MHWLIPLFCLGGAALLSLCNAILVHMGRYHAKELLKQTTPPFLFFPSLLQISLGHTHALYLAISLATELYLLAYALSTFVLFQTGTSTPVLIGLILLSAFGIEFLFRLIGTLLGRSAFRICAFLASLWFLPLLPSVGLLLFLTRALWQSAPTEEKEGFTANPEQLQEMLRESELESHLNVHERTLIASVVHFKEKVVKEIMVPRVDLFALPADITLKEAASLLAKESYSRIPLFRETLDHIIGIILYKDLLQHYATPGQNLDLPLETWVKPVLYAPENKKIAHLLQEFRTKQIHMAIIVDEYGGTEGIVTTEDILEELVGEIEDEYDIGGEQFWPLHSGGWIVDAKMSIDAIQEELHIAIPSSSEYETLGGYVSQKAGTIPAKGWRLLHNDFELEVLSSDERSVKKIKVIPHHH